MTSEKTVNEFMKEMRAAGFDFEFKATRHSDGLVLVSEGWIEQPEPRGVFEALPSPEYLLREMEGK